MRVAIDARPAVFAEKTGVGYYTWNLLKHLPRVDPSGRYLAWYLNARALLGGPRRNLRELPGVRERWTPIPARWFDRLESYELPRLEWFVRFDVLFAPNFVPPPSRTGRLVITVHDLRALKHSLDLFAGCYSAFVAPAFDPNCSGVVHVRFAEPVRHFDNDNNARFYRHIFGQRIDWRTNRV